MFALVYLWLILNIFHTFLYFCIVSIVDFQHLNVTWVVSLIAMTNNRHAKIFPKISLKVLWWKAIPKIFKINPTNIYSGVILSKNAALMTKGTNHRIFLNFQNYNFSEHQKEAASNKYNHWNHLLPTFLFIGTLTA